MQIIYTSLQTDNDASISPLSFFYRPDALPAIQRTACWWIHWTLTSVVQFFSLSFLSKILEHVIDSRGPIHRHCLKIYPKTCLSTITAGLFSHSAPDQDTGLLWSQQEVCCTTGVPLHCSCWLIRHLHDTAGCHSGCTSGLTVGCIVQTNIQPVVKPVSQPCWTNSHCSFNRLSNCNRVVQPFWQPVVYMMQPFVKPVVKRVWQPVECLYTRYNRLSNRFHNRFDNRLYRVNGPSGVYLSVAHVTAY